MTKVGFLRTWGSYVGVLDGRPGRRFAFGAAFDRRGLVTSRRSGPRLCASEGTDVLPRRLPPADRSRADRPTEEPLPPKRRSAEADVRRPSSRSSSGRDRFTHLRDHRELPTGTGLSRFADPFPAVTTSASPAASVALATRLSPGCVPSWPCTRLQPACVSQLVHDVCQNGVPVLGADRSGLVGEDGTSPGACSCFPAMRALPNLVIGCRRTAGTADLGRAAPPRRTDVGSSIRGTRGGLLKDRDGAAGDPGRGRSRDPVGV
jgi:hypothetical protein